jgi:hypothetical protein
MSLLACAGDAGTPQFPVESGLDEKRPLQTLSGTEAKQLCRSGAAAMDVFFDSDGLADRLCTLLAASNSIPAGNTTAKVNVDSCEKARTACLATPLKRERQGDSCDTFRIPGQCAVSVGEFERCTERYLETLLKQWEGVGCASLAMQTSLTLFEGDPKNASQAPGCERLESTCPGGGWPGVTWTVQRMARQF